MTKTKLLSELLNISDNEIKEYKEKLFRALHERSSLDYLTPNEDKLYTLLSKCPSVKFSCRDLLKHLRSSIRI